MRYACRMRTTLTIDADVLSAARDLAAHRNVSLGQVISELARRSLVNSDAGPATPENTFYGIAPLPRRGVVVSNDIINSIRDDEGI